MLPPEERLSGAQLHRYVKDLLYWVLHAPRQTGKTIFLKSWMRELNKTDDYDSYDDERLTWKDNVEYGITVVGG
jgi:predicted AAA+ superfamily ATPase